MIPGIAAKDVPLWIKAIQRVQDKRLDGFSYGEGRLFSKVLDRLAARLQTPSPQQAYDDALAARVKLILDGEPFKSQRLKMEEDRRLFEDAMRYSQSVHHSFWEIKNLSAIGVPEPPRGCPACKSAYDEYMAGAKNTHLQNAYDKLLKNYDALNSTHRRYMEELRQEKPRPSLAHRGSGYTPPEEPE